MNPLVVAVQVHDLVLELSGLDGGEAELTQVVLAQLVRVIVAHLRLSRERAQHGVRGEGAGEAARHDVITQLQTQVEPLGGREGQRVSFYFNSFSDCVLGHNIVCVCVCVCVCV